VNAAVGFGGRVRVHIVKLFEREIWISNWLFNMEVIGNRRAAKDGFTASRRSIYTLGRSLASSHCDIGASLHGTFCKQ
jgi:hypothetical protein